MSRNYTRAHTRLYTPSRSLALGVAVVMSASGCSGSLRSFFGPPEDETARDEMSADVEVASVPPAPPVRRASPPAKSKAPVMRSIVPAPVISIAGLGEDEVQRMLGQPQETSERNGRKIWIYRGAGCRVEVTFFRDVTRDTYAALAHKVVRTDGSEAADKACVRGARSAAGQ